jgi:hypothetical protein
VSFDRANTMKGFTPRELRSLAGGRFGSMLYSMSLATLVACGGKEAPKSSYLDLGPSPASNIDSGIHRDAEMLRRSDALTIFDAGFDDAMVDASPALDLGLQTDARFHPDAELFPDVDDAGPIDSGLIRDAEVPDSGLVGDDWDHDSISNADEGDGIYDSDQDGTPDAFDLDSDNDGLLDEIEAGDQDLNTPPVDTDNDGVPDARDSDSDGDTIPDLTETATDTDADGQPDYRDLDSDNDGLSDRFETAADFDGDGIANFRDLDSDNDGILDETETGFDDDNDDSPNAYDLDADGDGLLDSDEGLDDPDLDGVSNFRDPDSDGDGIADRFEQDQDRDGDLIPNYLDLDSDADGIPDDIEGGHQILNQSPFDSDVDGQADYLDHDSDNDQISDAHETSIDSDGDGLADFIDVDSDNDLITDNIEAGDSSTVTPPLDSDLDLIADYLDPDSDNDSISDRDEQAADPDLDSILSFRDLDSDGDSWPDSIEAGDTSTATPPVDTDGDGTADFLDLDSDDDLVPDDQELGCPAGPERILVDSDFDGLRDSIEIAYNSDPCDAASQIDAFYFQLPPLGPVQTAPLTFTNTNIDHSDIAINLDTTASMGEERNNLISSINSVVIPGINTSILDAAFSVSSFEDYPVFPFGSPNWGPDLPFRLQQRVTTDPSAVYNGVQSLGLRLGSDIPEAGLESLYQIATGFGTSWSGGIVPAFDAQANKVIGVADGLLGGVGFRENSLPIIVHITDAHSHVRADYQSIDPSITAVDTSTVLAALTALSARVVSIASSNLPRPLRETVFDDLCGPSASAGFGTIERPVASDEDWFLLSNAQAGDILVFETFAERKGSTLDTEVWVYDDQNLLSYHTQNFTLGTNDVRMEITLSGTGPFFARVKSELNNGGTNTETVGFYFFETTLNGVHQVPNPIGCFGDHGNDRNTATPLEAPAAATVPTSSSACVQACMTRLNAEYDPDRLPYSISDATRARVPPCAWDVFGLGRPAICPAGQCCTGLNGLGESPNTNGECPLAFTISENGQGLGTTIVTGIEALTQVAGFRITTRIRPDPTVLSQSGIDTSCFIRSVVPLRAVNTTGCAPTPVILDLHPPSPQADTFDNIAPGTQLDFEVSSANQDLNTGLPCVGTIARAQIFTAYLDVIADGVTTVDTRDIVIIVPGDGAFTQEH